MNDTNTKRFRRMCEFVAKRYPYANEVFLAKKVLLLAENKSYQELMRL